MIIINFIISYSKQIISDYQAKLKNSDESYSVISKCLADLKNNVLFYKFFLIKLLLFQMSDLELSNFMFNIIRIGSLYESNSSVKIFY